MTLRRPTANAARVRQMAGSANGACPFAVRRIQPVTTDPTRDSTAYIAPITSSETTFAPMTWTRLGFALQPACGVALGHATIGRIGFERRWEYAPVGRVATLRPSSGRPAHIQGARRE